MNTNHIYVHVLVENSATKDPDRRKPWKRDREQSQGYIEVDTGFIMPFRFKTFSVGKRSGKHRCFVKFLLLISHRS
jgi:hypothetical protein